MEVSYRAMRADEVPEVEALYKLAFGTEFQLSDPTAFRGDAGLVYTRYRAYPDGCLVGIVDGEVIGFCVVNRLGSVGVLGPVCVHPRAWNQGIARELVRRGVARIDAWGCAVAGLFTNPASPRHMRLYQSFGFWPRHLTVVMRGDSVMPEPSQAYESLATSSRSRPALLADARLLTGTAFRGLDLGREIESVLDLGFGDVLFRYDRDRLVGVAVCHYGKLSEGGSGALFIKFAQVAGGEGAQESLRQLVLACAAHARRVGVAKILVGVNTARHDAYRVLLELGRRSEF